MCRGSLVRPRAQRGDVVDGLGAGVPGRHLAVLIFAVQLHWLPALSSVSDIDSLGELLRAFAMPVMTLSFVIVAQMVRMTRAAVIDQLEAPYVEMARLKGASPAAHRADARAAERDRPDRQCRRAQPVVSARRRDHRRDHLQLSGHREADGRRVSPARHAAGADLRDDLLRRLPASSSRWPTCARIVANPRLRHR